MADKLNGENTGMGLIPDKVKKVKKESKKKSTSTETVNYTVKPVTPYRTYISPSSLYKARCPRCTWLNYQHNFQIPANLALQQKLSRLQESFFDNRELSEIDTNLPKGFSSLKKGKITSKNIFIDGQDTGWQFYGELDFIFNYADGSFGVADGKVSMKADPNLLAEDYWPQLQAYAFMLENNEENPILIKSLGLVRWRIEETSQTEEWGFTVSHEYIPIERDDVKFMTFINDFINVIKGEFPEPDKNCYDCKWLSKIHYNYGQTS